MTRDPQPAHVLLLPPAPQGGDGHLDLDPRWLGDALARTLRRRLEATGRRAVPIDVAAQAAKAAEVALGARLEERQVEHLLAETGATHVVSGTFCWGEEELALALAVRSPAGEPLDVLAAGPASDFQEVVDDAVVRLIQHLPGPKGEHVRGALRAARTTESEAAFLSLVRARGAYAAGDEAAFEDAVVEALQLDPSFTDPHDLVALAARSARDGRRALTALREVARIHGEAGRRHDQAVALLKVGRALVEGGEWDEGIAAYEQAAALFERQGEVRGWVQARMNVAGVLLRRGEPERAIEEYTAGLERVQGHPDDVAKHVFNLGLALKETGRLDEAAQRLQEALQHGFSLRSDELIASAYNALGAVYDDRGDLTRALHHFRRAEEHIDGRADPVLLAGVKDHIGIILKKQGKLEEALRYSEQACRLFERRGDPLHLAIAYVNRAGLLLELGREDEAAPFIADAHRDFVRLGSPSRRTTERMLRSLGVTDEELAELEAEAGEESDEELWDEDSEEEDLLDELELEEDSPEE